MAKTRREQYAAWLDAGGWRYSGNESDKGAYLFAGIFGAAALALVYSMFTLIFGSMLTPGWEAVNSREHEDMMAPWYETGLYVIVLLGGLCALIGEPFAWRQNYLRTKTRMLSCEQMAAVKTYRELADAEKKNLRSSLLDFLELEPSDSTSLFKNHDNAWRQLKEDIDERDKLLIESRAMIAGETVRQLSASIAYETQQLREESQP